MDKGLPPEPSLLELCSWVEAEERRLIEESRRALRLEGLKNELLQQEIAVEALRRELENSEDATLAGSHSNVADLCPPPPPLPFKSFSGLSAISSRVS